MIRPTEKPAETSQLPILLALEAGFDRKLHNARLIPSCRGSDDASRSRQSWIASAVSERSRGVADLGMVQRVDASARKSRRTCSGSENERHTARFRFQLAGPTWSFLSSLPKVPSPCGAKAQGLNQ